MPDRVSRCVFLLTSFMFFLALIPVADFDGIAAQSTTVVSEPEKQGCWRDGLVMVLLKVRT